MIVDIDKIIETKEDDFILVINNEQISLSRWFLAHKYIDVDNFKKAKKIEIKIKGRDSLENLTQNFIDSIKVIG
ncbi:hypothetical protein ACFLZ0_01690 [Patescibacteria group bacterium]